jgi:uncharacterized protein (TIGR02246 family)
MWGGSRRARLTRSANCRMLGGRMCAARRSAVRTRCVLLLPLQMKPDERAIREVHSIWIDAVNAGDLGRLLALMADDCLFLNPGQAPCGREGFSAVFSAAHLQAHVRCVSELEEVVVVSDVAYTRSRDSLSVTPRGGGEAGEEAKRLAGHRLTIYRKQSEGRWLLARDAHTLSPIAPRRPAR